MAPFIKVAFRAACHPSSLHTAHKRKMCPDFHFCSIIKGKSKTAQIHHIVKLVSWLQCSLTQSNKSWWWCALGWKTELALKRQWVISMVLTWFVCVWMCHNASPSALPLQPAGEQVPAELLSWILPWQTGRRVQTLSPGLCYLCRWELGSQDPSFFCSCPLGAFKTIFILAHSTYQAQVLRIADNVQKATCWRSGGVWPPAVPISTPQSQTQR